MLSLYDTVKISVTVLNAKIQQQGKTLCSNIILRSMVTTTISYK